MKYSPEQRNQIIKESEGKIIKSLEWDEDDEYWIMIFTDGSELMARLPLDKARGLDLKMRSPPATKRRGYE